MSGFSTVSVSPADVWTYVTRSLTDKAGFGLERLGASVLKGSDTIAVAGTSTVTILSITGSGIAFIARSEDSAGWIYPRIVIDGTTQSTPLDGTKAPASFNALLGTYYGKSGFIFPLIRFKSSFTWTEYNSDTVTHYIIYTYAYSLFGSKVEKEEVEEDTNANVRYRIRYYDTGAVIKFVEGNIKPVPPPKIETLEERIARLEAKVDKILAVLNIK